MRHAIVVNGVVINVAEASAEFGAEQGWIASETAGIGWTYENEEFSPPSAVVPTVDYAGIVRDSYKASLNLQAVRLNRKGKTFEAAQLLIKATEV